MKNMPTQYLYWSLPIIAVTFWALNISVTRYVSEFISPISMSFYRWLLAFILLTPFMLPKVLINFDSIRPHLYQLAIIGLFGMVLYHGLSYSAAHYTTATNMGMAHALIAFFTIFLSFTILNEKPSLFTIIGSTLSFLGLLFLISSGNISNLKNLGSQVGDLLITAAVFCSALYGVLLKKWTFKISLMLSLYIQIGFAVLFHIPLLIIFGWEIPNTNSFSSILYAAVLASIIAPLLWMLAIQKLGPNKASIFMNLMPILASVIAYIWLNEEWTSYHSISALCILVGILIAQLHRKNMYLLDK